MRRVAMLSLHTSPLAQPGIGDGGGMNVYVRELACALARAGAFCDVFTRAWSADLPYVMEVEPGFRVHHVPAGPLSPIPKEQLPAVVDEFTEVVLARMTAAGSLDGKTDGTGGLADRYDAVHAHYWLSGLSGHAIKHELDLPLVCTFHTLELLKEEPGLTEEPGRRGVHVPVSARVEAEASIIRCSDTVLASCSVEAEQIAEHYPVEPERVQVLAPGVDRAFFAPGHRPQARRALGLPDDGALLLFVGRLQPLKRADLAVRTLAVLRAAGIDAQLAIVGGPSGPQGEETSRGLDRLAARLGVAAAVLRVPPQPHELLSSYYRAADVTLVPSRSESFGLVALESAACGTPVVASAVGGLQTLVDHGRTGELVADPSPEAFASSLLRIIGEPAAADRLGTESVLRSHPYTWRAAAQGLLEIYADLVSAQLVEC